MSAKCNGSLVSRLSLTDRGRAWCGEKSHARFGGGGEETYLYEVTRLASTLQLAHLAGRSVPALALHSGCTALPILKGIAENSAARPHDARGPWRCAHCMTIRYREFVAAVALCVAYTVAFRFGIAALTAPVVQRCRTDSVFPGSETLYECPVD